jgi:hypothetical protein
MSTPSTAERYPTVRQGYDPNLVESDLAAMERAHKSVVDDAAAKIAALEHALELANSRHDAAGSGDAEQIVSVARKEAFQLITEARKEAGLVIAEARTEAEHTSSVAVAPNEGSEVLQAEELKLEARIVELQATLAGLESGMRSLTGMLATSSGAVPLGNVPAPSPAFADHVPAEPIALEGETPTTIPTAASNGGGALVDPLNPPQRNDTASPPPPPSEPDPAAAVQVEDLTVEVNDQHEQEPAPEGGLRTSFYTRRSAQLPHIGAEAGRNAIEVATGLRASMNDRVGGKTDS